MKALFPTSFEIAYFGADVAQQLIEFCYRHFFHSFFEPPHRGLLLIPVRFRRFRHVAHTDHFFFT